MLCKLCQQQPAIENSHIIPQFVSQWIKETSPLGGLRHTQQPNMRQEDTTKIPLLCINCENRMSLSEGYFSKEIFLPFNDGGKLEFPYDTWLLDFAVGLTWRVGQSLIDDLRTINPTIVTQVEQALQVWGNYLLGSISSSHPYTHHLFFDTMFLSRQFVGNAYDYRYAHRTIDYSIPNGPNNIAIYIKLPGMTFYLPIRPSTADDFQGTQIMNNGIFTATGQNVRDSFFWGSLRDSATSLVQSMSSMSEKQKQRLEERMKKAKPEWQIRREREEK